MDPRIEELCVNNDRPSDEVIQDVNNLLSKPLQDLKDLDDEILTLETRLEELKSKRSDSQKWVSRYQSVLAPIRRLSPEMLSEIFQTCLPFHTNPVLDYAECPSVFTRVCKLWRDVALSDPRLWRRIHISFADPFYIAALSSEMKTRDQEVFRKRLSAMKQWVSRARTMSLSVSIHFPEAVRGPNQSSITTKFLRFLAQISPRFMDLELAMPLELYRLLERMMDIPRMSKLVSLRISLPRQTVHGADPILLLKAPKLKHIFMFGSDPMLWGILAPSYSPGWHKFTKISCTGFLSRREVTSLLESCPNLVHFAVCIADPVNAVSSPYQGQISLPFLRTLFITDHMSFRSRDDLYERIDAPNVKWIMFTAGMTPIHPNDIPPPGSKTIPILPLLRRATQLKKLSINPISVEAWDMNSMLDAVSHTVTHLLVGYESRAPDGSLQRVAKGHDLRATPYRIDFGPFSLSDDYHHLPNLESFEINSHIITFGDEDFIKFITSRMSPSLATGRAALKRVAAVFYQLRTTTLPARPDGIGHDIDGEVRQYAEQNGVEMIDLSMNYVPVPVETSRVPKPDAGLVQLLVPSGNHGDADNYIRYHRLEDSEMFD